MIWLPRLLGQVPTQGVSDPTDGSSKVMTDTAALSPGVLCRGLVKRYEAVTAVDGIDLVVSRGECFGLLGPNGAGKTTTVEILEGLTAPDAGVVQVLGHTWGQGRDNDLRERIGVQLQDTQFNERLTVFETFRLFSSFYRRGLVPDDVITTVGLGDSRGIRVGALSGGQRQRLALGLALVGSPELLFLDEPTTGLDPNARLGAWRTIENFRSSGGTVLLTTHYMEEATHLCDRVAIMDRGKIIRLGSPSALVSSLGADQVIEFTPAGEVDQGVLAPLPGVSGVTRKHDAYHLTVQQIGLTLPALMRELEQIGTGLKNLTTHQATLEDVFISLTGRGLDDQ